MFILFIKKMIYGSNYTHLLFKSSQENEVIGTLEFSSLLSFQFNYCSDICNGKK